ncbi:protocadherin gamma subfamily A, 3 L homeolog isoform X31 [Xenopus laevis]|uniref:Protocadherin gamma subfamily A, 3 L homeolog isoform X31 n=1 Tax=Xenopus laevis TaxID=8355 RepID=A0A8J1MH44_XENLA|nr:protocadherin gamma subfamily A, 3 L homeolog isoform X31 [Xenopus laevis]
MYEKIKYRRTPRTMTWQVVFFLFFFYETCSGQVQYSIYEEMEQGSLIGNIATDLNIDIKELSFRKLQIVSQDQKQYISVNLENGDLHVTEKIDRETLCGIEEECFLDMKALMVNPLHIYTIKVEIQDINDNAPFFSKNDFEVGISESALPGARFALGYAQDPDLSSNSVQNYGLSTNEYFILGERISSDGSKNPELVLEKPLDREKQSSIELKLTAFDGGSPRKTGTTLIRIVVYDANDNYPVFSQDTYVVNINENAPNGSLVLQLQATDEDDSLNGEITYSFSHIPENAWQIFRINSQTGELLKVGELDYEVSKRYTITVEAKDGGDLVSHCKVSVQVIDANDNSPVIILNSFSSAVLEDSPPETEIALIQIYDADSGENGEIVCQISEMLPFQLISLTDNYYKIVTLSRLDREQRSAYNITITAKDKGLPSLCSNKTIQVTLTDINDNAPVFDKANYISYVPENNHPGTSILRIAALDLDINENGKITYNIISTDVQGIPASSHVSINSATGIVYALHAFDYETIREFHFQVMAKDSGFPPLNSTVSVRVCIIDRNDNYPNILYPASDTEGATYEFIPLSSEKGYLVTKVIAVDADSGHNAWLSYHLLQVQEPFIFLIGQHTGEIRLARDFEETDYSRQKLVVMVKDSGEPSLSATVTLNLIVAESFQVLPEINNKPIKLDTTSNITFYLVIAIAMVSVLFILAVIAVVISKCRNSNPSVVFGTLDKKYYPPVAFRYPSEYSDGTLPMPFSYDVCVTLDSSQNEFAYLRPSQNVPTDNLIDTDETATGNDSEVKDIQGSNLSQQAQPNADWRFSQAAQKPGPSGTQPTEEAGVWPNNQFETERLQAMILASANEAAEGTSGLGGGTGTMGLSARYGPQFTLQHVPDYRQNVYIPGSTLTPTNGGGKREGKGNKKKSSKKDKK